MAQEKAALSKIAGGNLAHMLWQRCISQKEFAAIVDRTPRTVRRWMYEGIPTLDDLQTITEALGVSVMDILSDSEDVHYFYMRGNLIFFTTVRKFKGLEAEVIICIDIDKETFSSPQERNVFYVGTSRAMAYLDLLSLSSPEELATAIDGGEIYSKRPQAIKAVRDCLKVKIASAFDLTDDMDS